MAITFFHTVKSFTQFLWNWKIGGSPLVDQNTANIRAEICSRCHLNVPSKDVRKGGCGTCNKMGNKVLDGIRDSIISGQRTTHDHLILTCGLCGCDLKISVWIPLNILLTPDDANAYPTNCWKKVIVQGREV